jgi:group I intron endonuclease
MHYIYIIENTLNHKVYIGQTKSPEARWKQHKAYANSKPVQYIHRAIAKDGYHNFTFTVIDFGLNQWQADCLEINYIATYDSRNPDQGYNFRPGGYVSERSQETRDKISAAKKGQFPTDETRTKLSKAHLGNKRAQGTKHTEQWKQEMSEWHQKHPNSGQFASDKTAPWSGKKRDPDTLKKAWETRKAKQLTGT